MRLHLANVSSKYGAPMGRVSYHATTETPLKFHLQRVPLNAGGYDSGGAYWGTPSNLYRAYAETDAPTKSAGWGGLFEGDAVDYYLRADSRAQAKRLVTEKYPNARFYR